MGSTEVTQVRREVGAALGSRSPLLLAVSGGLDSMCLLDAAVASRGPEGLHVATFDHGTGAHAARAAGLVEQRGRLLGVRVHAGRASASGAGEAAWRAARWEFLRAVSAETGTTIVTAHTRDDQVETVLMRVLRDAGARGIAGLYAASDIVRPLLGVSRARLARYAAAAGTDWVEDPTNASMAYLRNRVRRDLLPAMRRVRPSIDEELLDLARRAAEWRITVERLVDDALPSVARMAGRGLDVPVRALIGYSPDTIAIAWPVIVARVGVALDRRGTRRLTAFTISGGVGTRVQFSGGWEAVRARDVFQIRRIDGWEPRTTELAAVGNTRFGGGRWTFRVEVSERESTRDAWTASLPRERPLRVRPWRPGDVVRQGRDGSARKVKELLSAAGITGHDRAHWPVVLAGDEIVWIPGVRRTEAATARSGRPGLTYRCDYDNG